MVSACTGMHLATNKEPTILEEVCTELQVDCSDVEEPIIVTSRLVEALGNVMFPLGKLHGAHIPGEPYIFINPTSWKDQRITIVHEMVHYIIAQLQLPYDKCEGEQAAREITYKLTGQPMGDWRESYGCEADD